MKCAKTDCTTELEAGAKFCGGCGTAAATPMVKCGSGHDCPGDQKFCHECGEPMVKAVDAEFDLALETLVAMTKGGAAPEFVMPELGDGAIEVEQHMLKSGADLGLPEGTSVLDPEAMIKAIVGAGSTNAKGILGAIEQIGREQFRQAQILTAMVKAQASQMQAFRALNEGKIKGLEAAVTTIGATRNPRKAITTPLVKSLASGDPEQETQSPRGDVLIHAALSAEKNSMIKSQQVAEVQTMVASDFDLDGITRLNPQLGNVLAQQIRQGQTAH